MKTSYDFSPKVPQSISNEIFLCSLISEDVDCWVPTLEGNGTALFFFHSMKHPTLTHGSGVGIRIGRGLDEIQIRWQTQTRTRSHIFHAEKRGFAPKIGCTVPNEEPFEWHTT